MRSLIGQVVWVLLILLSAGLIITGFIFCPWITLIVVIVMCAVEFYLMIKNATEIHKDV
jgi:hypothetical protein